MKIFELYAKLRSSSSSFIILRHKPHEKTRIRRRNQFLNRGSELGSWLELVHTPTNPRQFFER